MGLVKSIIAEIQREKLLAVIIWGFFVNRIVSSFKPINSEDGYLEKKERKENTISQPNSDLLVEEVDSMGMNKRMNLRKYYVEIDHNKYNRKVDRILLLLTL